MTRGEAPRASLSSCSLSATSPALSSRYSSPSPPNLEFSSNPKAASPKGRRRAGRCFNLCCGHGRFWGRAGSRGRFSSASTSVSVLWGSAKLPGMAGGSRQQMNRSTEQLPQLHPPGPLRARQGAGGMEGSVGCKSQRRRMGRCRCGLGRGWAAPCQMCGGDGVAKRVRCLTAERGPRV